MSRLPLRPPYTIDYNPHVLPDDNFDMEAFFASIIQDLRKEVKDLTFIVRHLQEENDLLRKHLFPDRDRNRLE